MCRVVFWPGKVAHACLLGFFFLLTILSSVGMQGQQEDGSKPVAFDATKPIPILTGSTAYFTRVTAGQFQDVPSISPLLLVPIGDKWLIEGKGNYSDTYTTNAQGDYVGKASYGLSYLQADYITKYVTVTAGRFIAPFGIYGERWGPNWIRALQISPLINPAFSGSAAGGMFRGGFPAGTLKVNFNYAVYFSVANTNHILATDRSTGGRIGFFLPGPRLEFGASFQQVLQSDRAHAAGIHFVWQPNRVPLSVRSEYVRTSGTKGGGYWIESAYRLSQVPSLRRLELVGRGQQFFVAENLKPAVVKKLGALGKDTKQGDFGVNYYWRSDVRLSASYGRQFIQNKNSNLWTVGMTYRFVMPLWPTGSRL